MSSWNAVVVPSTPLMISRLGSVGPTPSGTPASSDADSTTLTSPSVADPLGEVRELAVEGVRWLVTEHPLRILVLTAPADPANVARGVPISLGERVARSLLAAAGFTGEVAIGWSSSPRGWSSSPRNEGGQSRPEGGQSRPLLPDGTGVLVVGDGSARRGEKAPGHLDERSFSFDSVIDKALRDCDAPALGELDASLGADLLAAGVPAFRALGALPGASEHSAVVDYADDPLGVQYWIVRWTCVS